VNTKPKRSSFKFQNGECEAKRGWIKFWICMKVGSQIKKVSKPKAKMTTKKSTIGIGNHFKTRWTLIVVCLKGTTSNGGARAVQGCARSFSRLFSCSASKNNSILRFLSPPLHRPLVGAQAQLKT